MSNSLALAPRVQEALSIVPNTDDDDDDQGDGTRKSTAVGGDGRTYEKIECVRIVLVGDSNVGKSEFSHCFKTRTFSGTTVASIGMGFTSVDMLLCDKRVYARVELYDTAGQERFAQQIMPTYYRRSRGVIIMFDPQNNESLVRGTKLYAQITDDVPDIVCMFVANKTDLFQCTDDEKNARLAKIAKLLCPQGQPTRRLADHVRPEDIDMPLRAISLKQTPEVALDLVAELSQRIVMNNASASVRASSAPARLSGSALRGSESSRRDTKSDTIQLRRQQQQQQQRDVEPKKPTRRGFCFF